MEDLEYIQQLKLLSDLIKFVDLDPNSNSKQLLPLLKKIIGCTGFELSAEMLLKLKSYIKKPTFSGQLEMLERILSDMEQYINNFDEDINSRLGFCYHVVAAARELEIKIKEKGFGIKQNELIKYMDQFFDYMLENIDSFEMSDDIKDSLVEIQREVHEHVDTYIYKQKIGLLSSALHISQSVLGMIVGAASMTFGISILTMAKSSVVSLPIQKTKISAETALPSLVIATGLLNVCIGAYALLVGVTDMLDFIKSRNNPEPVAVIKRDISEILKLSLLPSKPIPVFKRDSLKLVKKNVVIISAEARIEAQFAAALKGLELGAYEVQNLSATVTPATQAVVHTVRTQLNSLSADNTIPMVDRLERVAKLGCTLAHTVAQETERKVQFETEHGKSMEHQHKDGSQHYRLKCLAIVDIVLAPIKNLSISLSKLYNQRKQSYPARFHKVDQSLDVAHKMLVRHAQEQRQPKL